MIWFFAGCVTDPATTTSEPTTGPTPTDTTQTPTGPPTTTTVSTESGDTGTAGPQSVLQFTGKPPENLLIISLDTTRRDRIGRFGYYGNTPNLNAKMAEGVALDNHRSCSSWTGPSMTCVTTGSTPFDQNWFPWTSDPEVSNWNDDIPTLARQLRFQKGFHTALVTANGVMGPFLPLANGFEVVQNLDYQPAANVTDAGLSEAQALVGGDAPFYLHVHYMDPHQPYCPPDDYVEDQYYTPLPNDVCTWFWYLAGAFPYQSEGWRQTFMGNTLELYDAELDYWDVEFQRLWDGLDAMGALDDTLVMFVTDHGEQFYERGGWGHGNTLAAEENRSTAMFWAKNIIPQAWTEPTVHEDLGTTLIDYFGTKPQIGPTGVVVGMAPADRPLRAMLYWSGGGSAQLSIVQGDLQLTYNFWGEKHLWDYSLDDAGMNDFYDPNDPDVQALWVPMQAYIDEVLAKWPSSGPTTNSGP